jgi:hypothetical protein
MKIEYPDHTLIADATNGRDLLGRRYRQITSVLTAQIRRIVLGPKAATSVACSG